jgi:hypothetical protein
MQRVAGAGRRAFEKMFTISLRRERQRGTVFVVRFIPGDEGKDSLKAWGLTFEQIALARVLDTLPNPIHPDQILLIVEIAG